MHVFFSKSTLSLMGPRFLSLTRYLVPITATPIPNQRPPPRNILLLKKIISLTRQYYSKPSIIRQLWSSATNLPGHFAITPVSKLPWLTATLTYPPWFALDQWWRIIEGLLYININTYRIVFAAVLTLPAKNAPHYSMLLSKIAKIHT